MTVMTKGYFWEHLADSSSAQRSPTALKKLPEYQTLLEGEKKDSFEVILHKGLKNKFKL